MQRQKTFPKCIYTVAFGEKTMSAHIHTVPVYIDGFGNAADRVAFFKNRDSVPFGRGPQQLKPCRQPRRPCADNHNRFFWRFRGAQFVLPLQKI